MYLYDFCNRTSFLRIKSLNNIEHKYTSMNSINFILFCFFYDHHCTSVFVYLSISAVRFNFQTVKWLVRAISDDWEMCNIMTYFCSVIMLNVMQFHWKCQTHWHVFFMQFTTHSFEISVQCESWKFCWNRILGSSTDLIEYGLVFDFFNKCVAIDVHIYVDLESKKFPMRIFHIMLAQIPEEKKIRISNFFMNGNSRTSFCAFCFITQELPNEFTGSTYVQMLSFTRCCEIPISSELKLE